MPPGDQLKALERLAHANVVYLVIMSLISFLAGAYAVTVSQLDRLIPMSLLGLSGSAAERGRGPMTMSRIEP
jgi:hypothetical protein